MNRREALKKLGAGGAIASGASVVLLSNGVAYAASGTIGVPDRPTVNSYSYLSNALTISLNALPPSCTIGPSNPSYSWSNASGTVQGQQVVSTSGSNSNSVVLVRTGNPAPQNPWGNGDVFTVNVTVTWSCSGANVQQTYTVQATIPGIATVT